MAKHILFCESCKKFTMNEECDCGMKTVSHKPLKFSLQEKYADYRRKAKEEHLLNKKII